MIRRDYLLGQIEQFVVVLARLTGLAKGERWQEASKVAASQFQALAGADVSGLLRMSDTELLARLIQGEPTQVIEQKIFMLATLFKTNGDVLMGQGNIEEGRANYLKGLHLLLDVFGRSETARRPDFVPTIEAFLTGLGNSPLPLATGVMLMCHYERLREYGKAEDVLFDLLESGPDNVPLLDFGLAFYQRLLHLSDDALAAGNLPRAEVNEGIAELNERKSKVA